MQKRAIIFANFYHGFLKSSSALRLANELRSDGFEVKQIHHFVHFSNQELEIIIEDFCKDKDAIVCISTSFLSEDEDRNKNISPTWGTNSQGVDIYEKIFHVCYNAKKYNAKVLIGGWLIDERKMFNYEIRKRWKLNLLEPYVDYFVLGSGASTIKKTAENLEQNVVTRKLVSSDPITDFSNVSTAVDITDFINNKESLAFEIASGCVFSCHFCNFGSLGKKKHEYMRDYQSLKNELISNYENFGTRMYNLTDNISNDYYEKLKYLIKIKDETGIDFKWAGYVRLDTIKNKEQANLIRDSGMVGALMGIESFTPSVGKYIGKMTDKHRLIEILHLCRESWGDEAIISAMFIAGLPTETEEQIIETFNFLTSKEGYHLIDTFKFNKFHLDKENDNKNEINKARNGPFKDYVHDADVPFGNKWTSPWSNSESIAKLVLKLNQLEHQKTIVTAHLFAEICNHGYEPEELAKLGRNGIKHWQIRLYDKNIKLFDNYRHKIMIDIQNRTD